MSDAFFFFVDYLVFLNEKTTTSGEVLDLGFDFRLSAMASYQITRKAKIHALCDQIT